MLTETGKPLLRVRPRFTIRSLLVLTAVVAVLATIGVVTFRSATGWNYTGQLHAMIDGADRIVVRNYPNILIELPDPDEVIFEIHDRNEVQRVNRNIAFAKRQQYSSCECGGYPTMEWYNGDTLITSAALAHGKHIKWRDGNGWDMDLTSESQGWIVQWMIDNGVQPGPLN